MNAPTSLREQHQPDQLEIYRDGADTPFVTQMAQRRHRPYIHPLVAPDGNGVLTENQPGHHLWQHGLYVGLNDVNGVGFWTEGHTNDPKDGSFDPSALNLPVVNANRAAWDVTTKWLSPTKSLMLTEMQHWRLTDSGDFYTLDLDWLLTAATDLTFGKYGYGGLFLRMPWRKETGGRALTSEGLGLPEAEGQRARWVGVSMPIAGRDTPAGIAFLDHPDNPEHPVPWRVDGQLGISPSRCIAGAWELKQNEHSRNRYRVVVFNGDSDADFLNDQWNAFAQ
ncbi:MAG: PmoA family protein [Candidatus Poribacteria bacterium]|nr:PmoA family protein [Candidatus Poribacteria bacterium]